MTQRYNIVLADDHRLVLDGIVRILSGLGFVGGLTTVSSAEEALSHPALAAAQLLITDIEMKHMSGIELLRRAKQQYPSLKVLVLSMHNDPGLAREIIALNGDGYVLKTADEGELQLAVSSILSGRKYFTHDVTAGLVAATAATGDDAAGLDSLTQREREVLRYVAQGHSNKEIAELLFVSAKTVDSHRTNLMNKLDIHNVAGLTRFAVRHKLI